MQEPFSDSEKAEQVAEYANAEQYQNEESPEDRPLLFVDINLGEDQIERIVVYDGDTAAQLAKDFSRKHGKNIQALPLINFRTGQGDSIET